MMTEMVKCIGKYGENGGSYGMVSICCWIVGVIWIKTWYGIYEQVSYGNGMIYNKII